MRGIRRGRGLQRDSETGGREKERDGETGNELEGQRTGSESPSLRNRKRRKGRGMGVLTPFIGPPMSAP